MTALQDTRNRHDRGLAIATAIVGGLTTLFALAMGAFLLI